jgi:hypothetical protein
MARMGRNLLVATALVLLGTCRLARGQAPEEAPRPAVLGAPTLTPSAPAPAPVVPANAPVPSWPPPEYKLPPLDESMTRPAPGDPLLDYPVLAPPGWFANVEVGVLAAHFKNHLQGDVSIGGTVTTVRVPSAPLDWGPAPRFEFGYRLPRGFGEFLASYQFLSTQGQSDLGVTLLKSRLAQNVLNVDYANPQLLANVGFLGEGWLISGRVGVQVLGIYYDTRSDQRGLDGTLTGQQITNNLVGAGPHAQLDVWRRLFLPGLAFYGSVEAANIWDHLEQSFTETILAPGAAPVGGTVRGRLSQGVASLGGRLGFSWTPPANSAIRLFLGYQFNQWWQVGRNGATDTQGANGDLTEHGIFFRGEFTF